ncbi:a kinase anchor protein [Culex quinquefasciatus]|uniref:A kinase anchor protein n=1 Tax=Culex quinquefasciatus TaxID=7176 RepID=B0XJA4_CULQU|nr:A-kinase anchor protein 1, mitochondrial [Culex quinquefasciatus]XP_038104075.1 A-kinase anchor protein 1, mitochondrial [Culex quinquefasciatus]EDS30141.1 a kinase anchor protein [Culex quinquefasciatus]|eukprot:XP_001869726.1 a kinase anchor protein [Culex quinquefasciatus]
MVSGRPLLYLSLPGLALIIGLVWFRRKKIVGFDTGGKSTSEGGAESVATTDDSERTCEAEKQDGDFGKQTESLPITPSANLKHDSGKNQSSSASSSSSCSGKSAPIDIVSNTRSPPKFSDQQLDAELLKLKIEESDIRNLRLIEEQDDYSSFESPVNLPGTVDRYKNFNRFNRGLEPQTEPVVIKASMTAKISPQNSFATELSPSKETEMRNSSSVDLLNNNSTTNMDSVNFQADADTINNNIVDEPQAANGEEIGSHSPALSICSMRSGDSGKGSSPPQSECAPITSYDFFLPVYLVSKMLGRKAGFVQLIKAKTGVNVLIKRNPDTHKTKICTLEGTQAEIDNALVLIRKKFPEKRFSALTLQRVHIAPTENVVPLPLIDTTCFHLQLVEGINNDVSVSSIVNGGHVFLQQPLHPSFPSLNTLQQCLNQSYNMTETPQLPEITENAICVTAVQGNWFRVQIVSHSPEDQHCLVKYLDYGGYANVPVTSLRQIRTDFMAVPFQSIECVLSNVKPSGDSGWTPGASEALYSLSKGLILQAQVAGYTAEGLPEIYLYASLARDNIIFINHELAARGLAEWVENEMLPASS